MVKLASARENRLYGPWLARNQWEYINAGLYVFATVLLLCGFVSQLSNMSAKSGLVLLLISSGIIIVVNLHDLLAHYAGIDYRLSLLQFDPQLGMVELFVPIVQALGSLLFFLGILLLFIEVEKGFVNHKLEKHALNMLIAGPILWIIGSIHNVCQVYQRAGGRVQVLQASVQIPFLLGSLLFLVGAILNSHDHVGRLAHHGLTLLGKSWIWLGIFGSSLFLLGGLMNLVKVFKMQQIVGLRLEKLRGGAQERLNREREGQVPLILEGERRKSDEGRPVPVPTPYKDVLIGQA